MVLKCANRPRFKFDIHVYRLYYACMKQLNINVTREFEHGMRVLMKKRNIAEKSVLLRVLVAEAVANLEGQEKKVDFRQLIGIGLRAPLTNPPGSLTEDDLWS